MISLNRRTILIGLMACLVTSLVAGYFALQAIPPRYVARLPEPLQALAAPETSAPLLPTVAVTADLQALLAANDDTAAPASVQLEGTPAPPPTFTPPAVGADSSAKTLPATFTPEPTPTATATPPPLPATVRLDGIIHQFQSWNNCGPATMAMTLTYFGMGLGQSQTAAVLKPNPEDRNVSPWEMAAYVNEETPYEAIFRANGRIDTIRHFLSEGIPVILEIGIEPPGEFRWMGWYGHYLLVVAYDDNLRQFWVYDSWFGTSEEPLTNADPAGRVLSYDDVRTYWPHFNRNYIAVYRPEQTAVVEQILGADINDDIMWQNALARTRSDAASAPNNAFHWFNLGTAYNALGQYEEAAAAFDQARAIGLPWRMLWYQFGPYEAYYQVGRYEDVVLLADVTLDDRPYFEESFYYKGLAQLALGQTDSGRNNLERAAAFNPNFAPAATALANLNSGG